MKITIIRADKGLLNKPVDNPMRTTDLSSLTIVDIKTESGENIMPLMIKASKNNNQTNLPEDNTTINNIGNTDWNIKINLDQFRCSNNEQTENGLYA